MRQRSRSGAGDETTGRNVARNGQADHVVSSGRELGLHAYSGIRCVNYRDRVFALMERLYETHNIDLLALKKDPAVG
jgi:hypothetical protein